MLQVACRACAAPNIHIPCARESPKLPSVCRSMSVGELRRGAWVFGEVRCQHSVDHSKFQHETLIKVPTRHPSKSAKILLSWKVSWRVFFGVLLLVRLNGLIFSALSCCCYAVAEFHRMPCTARAFLCARVWLRVAYTHTFFRGRFPLPMAG